MKMKIFWIALVAMMGITSAVAQTATPLSFTGDRAVINSGEKFYIPQTVWSAQKTLYIDIVNTYEPELGFEGWTGQNSWSVPGSSQWIGNTPAIREQYIKIDVPGLWTNMYQGNFGEIRIRRIADPTLTVGSDSKPLSQWGSTINVLRGTNVELSVHSFFVSGGGSNALFKDGSLFGGLQIQYSLTETGNYEIKTEDGISNNAMYSNTFQVNFIETTFTLTATAGSGGTISPSGNVTVNQGENQTFTATPDNGKMVDEWKVDGNVVANSGDTYTVSNVQVNAAIQVTFKDKPPVTFILTATAGSGGTISPSGSVTVNQGENQTFTATPDNGKMVDEWKVDGNVVATSGNTYTVSNVQANATIQVTFKDKPPVTFTLTATAGSGGTISPSGSVTVNQGENQTFTATPDNGKMIDQWKVDGNVVASTGNTYTVSNVQANATIQVTFKDVPPVEEVPIPVFDGLEGEYTQSSVAIPLKLKGNDSEKFTIFKVNGEVKTEFIPNVKGWYKIEAITADGKSRIETYVNVK